LSVGDLSTLRFLRWEGGIGLCASLGPDSCLHRRQTAALVLFVKKWTEDKALAALAPLGGEVLKTSLSDEATKEINAALEAD
jgi:hypothetical protein